jgi:hypothetical protein
LKADDVHEPIRLLARVRCRSEGQGEECPVAVRFGGKELAIRATLADAVVGPVRAGMACERRVMVELAGGDRLELVRRLPDGGWRVGRVSYHCPQALGARTEPGKGGGK